MFQMCPAVCVCSVCPFTNSNRIFGLKLIINRLGTRCFSNRSEMAVSSCGGWIQRIFAHKRRSTWTPGHLGPCQALARSSCAESVALFLSACE